MPWLVSYIISTSAGYWPDLACMVSSSLTPLSWLQEELFIKFAEFEERCKEHDRARAIYRYALDHIPKNQADAVYQRFVTFEKQYGDREGIEVCPPLLYWHKRSLLPLSCHWGSL